MKANAAVATRDEVIPLSRQSMRVRRTRARRTDDRRTVLIDLGRAIFAEHAYDEISIDDIASSAGISRGLLYHYFPGKWEFYLATMRDSALRFRDVICVEDEEHAHDGVAASLDAALGFVEQNGMLYSSLMHGGARVDAEVRASLDEAMAHVVAQALRATGRTAAGPMMSGALQGWMRFVESAALSYADHPELGRETVLQLIGDVLETVLSSATRLETALVSAHSRR